MISTILKTKRENLLTDFLYSVICLPDKQTSFCHMKKTSRPTSVIYLTYDTEVSGSMMGKLRMLKEYGIHNFGASPQVAESIHRALGVDVRHVEDRKSEPTNLLCDILILDKSDVVAQRNSLKEMSEPAYNDFCRTLEMGRLAEIAEVTKRGGLVVIDENMLKHVIDAMNHHVFGHGETGAIEKLYNEVNGAAWAWGHSTSRAMMTAHHAKATESEPQDVTAG